MFPTFFRLVIWSSTLASLLRSMLNGDHITWTRCYREASILIQHNNAQFEYLRKIFINPKRYSMWAYRENRGHLNRHGSVAAEQNHSSIKSYLGKGGTLSLLDNVRKIIERDHQHNAERCSKRNALLVRSSDQYKSDRNGHLN